MADIQVQLEQAKTELERATDGTKYRVRRFIAERGPAFAGHFCSGHTMPNKCDFFQEQIKKCNRLAERASNKTDCEFWLGMARRWEAMLEAGERGMLDVEVKPRFERPLFKKKGRWSRAA
jgi:hypothetical protein